MLQERPRKRLRRLASLKEGDCVDRPDGERETKIDGTEALKVRPVLGRVTRSRALLSTAVLTGKNANGNVFAGAQARRAKRRSSKIGRAHV